ncbi:MAG TPA: hypothetical protein VGN75_13690 [Kaistia sp.]|jgi:hypothetical protein|nr:hypothetical protein [Kaistia sp.]
MSINRKQRRALRGEEFKITPRGDYDTTRAEVNEDGMTVMLIAFRAILKGSPGAEALSDRDVFNGTVELIQAGYMDVYVRYRGTCIDVRPVFKLPGVGTFEDFMARSIQ